MHLKTEEDIIQLVKEIEMDDEYIKSEIVASSTIKLTRLQQIK